MWKTRIPVNYHVREREIFWTCRIYFLGFCLKNLNVYFIGGYFRQSCFSSPSSVFLSISNYPSSIQTTMYIQCFKLLFLKLPFLHKLKWPFPWYEPKCQFFLKAFLVSIDATFNDLMHLWTFEWLVSSQVSAGMTPELEEKLQMKLYA